MINVCRAPMRPPGWPHNGLGQFADEETWKALRHPQFVWDAIHHIQCEVEQIADDLARTDGAPRYLVSALENVANKLAAAKTVEALHMEKMPVENGLIK